MRENRLGPLEGAKSYIPAVRVIKEFLRRDHYFDRCINSTDSQQR